VRNPELIQQSRRALHVNRLTHFAHIDASRHGQ
jgi:hypothetical protein